MDYLTSRKSNLPAAAGGEGEGTECHEAGDAGFGDDLEAVAAGIGDDECVTAAHGAAKVADRPGEAACLRPLSVADLRGAPGDLGIEGLRLIELIESDAAGHAKAIDERDICRGEPV